MSHGDRLNGAARAGRGARRFAREALVLLGFCAMTAVMTWPYVNYRRDAVADPGDPYLVAWILWWDYHQTFTDPLNLFHSNVFYPYRYTLAFSEHCYGIALLFFPLFALGARPLTVHAVAMFFGFALCGYGAFRLARTLTGSVGAGWVAGVVFAFIPYRFHLLSHLPYLFSPWIPLLIEAVVLFARRRSRGRAVWLGVALFMSGLTSVSWFALSLVPAALVGAVLLTRRRAWRDPALWRRGGAAVAAACAGLVPFMLPYYIVAKTYGFVRPVWEIQAHSARPSHWLSAEDRNKLWSGLGSGLAGRRQRLFPGLLPLLLSLAALLLVRAPEGRGPAAAEAAAGLARARWVRRLDALAVVAFALSVCAAGFAGTYYYGGLFQYVTSERTLALLTVVVTARLCLAYPAVLRRGESANLIETIRSRRRGDAFWVGVILSAVGFFYSLGWNFFFYRILHDLLPIFRSMRVASRGAMVCYLGLAILAGLGAKRVAGWAGWRRVRAGRRAVYAAACALLLLELNAAPLRFERGAVFPDAVTQRLKQTPMRGGVVNLPAGPEYNHRHILRSADHARPLVVGTSGFNPPTEDRIEQLTRSGPVSSELLDLFEQVPASYVVIHNQLITPERRADYEGFLGRGLASGRLRFIRRFEPGDDLYAVTRTEPDAKQEAPLPFEPTVRDWGSQLRQDPVNMLGAHVEWTQKLYRLHLAATGRLPRYADFLPDVEALASGVVEGTEEGDRTLEVNLRALADELAGRPSLAETFGAQPDDEYVGRLLSNAGLSDDAALRQRLTGVLSSGHATRAGTLLMLAEEPRFAERERNRSLVLLHFFGYLLRNPDDPPDNDLRGLMHWVGDLDRGGDPAKLPLAFKESVEYRIRTEHPK